MSLKEEREKLRKQINEERDIRERDSWSGGPAMFDRPIAYFSQPIFYRKRPQKNLRQKGTAHYS